jgi:hypothetical protein
MSDVPYGRLALVLAVDGVVGFVWGWVCSLAIAPGFWLGVVASIGGAGLGVILTALAALAGVFYPRRPL